MKEWWLISTAVYTAMFMLSFAQNGKSAFDDGMNCIV